MNKQEAESYIYASYLKAEAHQSYASRDAEKRNPAFSRDLLRGLCHTPCVVVTGSKGKGSVACMVSQLLQSRLKVGRMTSPHLVDFCERFCVNGRPISDADFVQHVAQVRPLFDQLVIPDDKYVSPMGIQAALALSYFQACGTDFNVFECGKGARFDDVNNIPHPYAVINSIFLEHTRELGGTLAEIAADKAHVITGAERCVFVAEQHPEAMAPIRERARALQVPLRVYGEDFRCERVRYTAEGMKFDVVVGHDVYPDLLVPLLGAHQAKNCALAMAVCHEILGRLPLSEVRPRLAALRWPGRMEILSTDPFVLLDACINAESTVHVLRTLEFLQLPKCVFIVGIPDDKDYAHVVKSIYPAAAQVLLTRSQNRHYVFTENQRLALAKEGYDTTWTTSVEAALALAKTAHLPIVILGTTSVVSEVELYYKKENL